jgi:hypothetical protein
LNALQAAGIVTGIDTTSAQAAINQAILDSIHSRVDVDTIVNDPSATISWGTASDGTPLNFSQVDLDLLDRMLGAYLTQQFSSTGQITSAAVRQHTQRLTRSGDKLVLGRRHLIERLQAAPQGLISSLLQQITTATTVGNATAGALTANNWLDAGSAVMSGAEPFMNSPTWTQSSGILGVFSGLTQIKSSLDSFTSNLGLAFDCAASTTQTNCRQQADNVQNSALNFANSEIQTFASIPSIAGIGGALSQAIASTTAFAANLGTMAYNYWTTGTTGSSLIDTAVNTYNSITSISQSAMSSDGVVQGDSSISFINAVVSGLSAPQATIQACCFGPSGLAITTTADVNGAYSFDIPTGVGGTNYSNLTLTALDPTTGTVLATIPVDLSALTPLSTGNVATTLAGSCVDDDDDAYDDPDCD